MINVITILVLLMILVLKMTKKVSNNMILMSKYKGKHGGKKGPKNSGMGRPPPPHSGNARKKTFFSIDVFPNYIQPLDTALVTGRAQIGWGKRVNGMDSH